jgi:hypothetical protein
MISFMPYQRLILQYAQSDFFSYMVQNIVMIAFVIVAIPRFNLLAGAGMA